MAAEELKEWATYDFSKLKRPKDFEEVALEFRDHLKFLIKEKEQLFKQKIEKRLFGKIREIE